MIWFTSDQHFGHQNIIRYTKRPFKSVKEMDTEIIKRHNTIVISSDDVYILGDFTLRDGPVAADYIAKLNGNLHFISGSHDYRWIPKDARMVYVNGREIRILPPLYSLLVDRADVGMQNGEHPLIIVLCHYAMRKWDRSHYDSLHLFGHSHGTLQYPTPRSMDVGVDCNHFSPVSLDQVIKRLVKGVVHG